jgi:hypothetical protein
VKSASFLEGPIHDRSGLNVALICFLGVFVRCVCCFLYYSTRSGEGALFKNLCKNGFKSALVLLIVGSPISRKRMHFATARHLQMSVIPVSRFSRTLDNGAFEMTDQRDESVVARHS